MTAQDLYDAIRVGREFWRDYNNEDHTHKFWYIFQSLLALSERSPELEAGKPKECKFSTADLLFEIAQYQDTKAKWDNGRLRKEFNKLNDRLTQLQPLLSEHAKNLNLNVSLSVKKEQSIGGKGNVSYYRLVTIPLTTQTKEIDASIPNAKDMISYQIESVANLPIWASWLQKINMDKHRWLVTGFTLSPIICAAILPTSIWLLLTGSGGYFTSLMASFCFCYIVLFLLFFKYFISAANNNIALLPEWMLPLSLKSAVMEYELNEPNSKKYRQKKLVLKVYKAKCPICGYRINLRQSGIPLKERLIGECDYNPREHRYSFDFTTRTGCKLNRN